MMTTDQARRSRAAGRKRSEALIPRPSVGNVGVGSIAGALLVGLLLAGCGGQMPTDLGVIDSRLRNCPDSPNCVSSFASDEEHSIDAYLIKGSASAAWGALVSVLSSREDVEIVDQRDGYLHAVFTTRLMRYRDDVEFLLDPVGGAGGKIDLRSASRVGYGDGGANRDRIEALRTDLAAQGVVQAASASPGA